LCPMRSLCAYIRPLLVGLSVTSPLLPARSQRRVIISPALSAWEEWSLRDVGLFDSAALAISAISVAAASAYVDRGASQANATPKSRVRAASTDPMELPPFAGLREPKGGRSTRRSEPRMSAPPEALADIVIPAVAEVGDERLWVPQTECLSFRPLCLCVSQGYYVNLLRFQGGGVLGCHRHASPVHAHTIKGTWGYKEHTWEAGPGTYVFEPPGETHTLVVGEAEMITLFHVTGALIYCDPETNEVTGFDDVFTKLEKAKRHYEACGLGADYVQQFVR